MDLLITLKQAKQHLKLPTDVTSEDADLLLKLQIAQDWIIDYVTQNREDNDAWSTTVQAWEADTAPKQVLAAILVQFGVLYRNRGDDGAEAKASGRWDAETAGEYGAMHPLVVALLKRLRDPALA